MDMDMYTVYKYENILHTEYSKWSVVKWVKIKKERKRERETKNIRKRNEKGKNKIK